MIFVHSSFRTSSTFLWSRIRTNTNATAYYEVFNDALANLSLEKVRLTTAESWPSKHPAGAPYYLEYLPLLDEHGKVSGYDPSMAMERFIPADGPSGAVSDLEARFVRGLVDHAEARGRIPVLTAVRSVGRVSGLKAAVPGLHVLLYRNLFQQWCSYTALGMTGITFALDHALWVVRNAHHDPIVRQISELIPIEDESTKSRNAFYQFVLLHLYCYAHAAAAADVVLDINRVATDTSYRQDVESLFADQALRVDLAQAKQSIGYAQLEIPSKTELRDFLTVAGNVVIGSGPSESGRRFAEKALSDLFDEYERHEFHAKAIRSALGHAVEARESARAEADAAKAERDAARTAQGEASAALDEERRARAAAEAAQANALAQAEASRLEREAACAEAAAIRSERNTALAHHDDAVLARQEAEAERERAERERHAEAAARQVAEAGHAASRAEAEAERQARKVAEAERDSARGAWDRSRAEADAARAVAEAERRARERTEAERDAARAERDRSRVEAEAACEAAEAERARAEVERRTQAKVREAAEAEREASRSEADAARHARGVAEADAARHARGAAEAERNVAIAERDRMRAEGERMQSDRATVAAERDAARIAAAEAEARHAALLRWSVAFHDSTAASLSWRVTRPLRWLRIGRPRRPGTPPP